MEEEQKDVQAESSPVEETKQEVVETEESTPSPVEETPPSTQEVKPEVKDDRPIENVAWETKRKLDELVPTLKEEIGQLKTYIQEQGSPQQPKYTSAQLKAYAADPTTTTEQRLWAWTEVDKIEKAERAKEYENLVRTTRERSESENRKAQSAQWVANTFPDTVLKDVAGNMVGWNNQSPLLAKANDYMNRSSNLRNDPDGFMAAVKMAAFDLGVGFGTNKKIDKTIGQLRKEQKKQLASTGGTRISESPETTSKNKMAKLQAEYKKTGDKRIFAEIVKLRGLNPFT